MARLNLDTRRTPVRRIIPMLAILALLAGCAPPPMPELQQATVLPNPKILAGFRLVDQDEQPFTPERLRGHWSFAFFGYTHCPDVCPMSLTMLAQVQRKLVQEPDIGQQPQGLFFSVDPERDTPELLSGFVPYFHPDFIGVTGDAEQIKRLTRQLGIVYGKVDPEATEGYLVDHSAAIILFDPQGRFYALFNVPHDPDKIASDFVAIKDYYEATR
jgi:protein SCO1/2